MRVIGRTEDCEGLSRRLTPYSNSRTKRLRHRKKPLTRVSVWTRSSSVLPNSGGYRKDREGRGGWGRTGEAGPRERGRERVHTFIYFSSKGREEQTSPAPLTPFVGLLWEDWIRHVVLPVFRRPLSRLDTGDSKVPTCLETTPTNPSPPEVLVFSSSGLS